MKSVTAKLEPEVYKAFRRKLLDEDRKAKDIVTAAVKLYLEDKLQL